MKLYSYRTFVSFRFQIFAVKDNYVLIVTDKQRINAKCMSLYNNN